MNSKTVQVKHGGKRTLEGRIKESVKRRIDIEDEQRSLQDEKASIEVEVVKDLFDGGHTQFLKVDWSKLVRSL